MKAHHIAGFTFKGVLSPSSSRRCSGMGIYDCSPLTRRHVPHLYNSTRATAADTHRLALMCVCMPHRVWLSSQIS